MECITCALCIDACDDVMDKIGKPRGLIDYFALSDEAAERGGSAPAPLWKHVLRPRTLLYTVMWAAIGAGLVYALFIRSDIEMTVSPVRDPTCAVIRRCDPQYLRRAFAQQTGPRAHFRAEPDQRCEPAH